MRKQKLLITFASLALCGAAPAGFAQSPVSNVSVSPYGQLNYGVLVGDTGNGSENFIVDNTNSGSRVGAKIKGDLEGTDLTVGAHVELGYEINRSVLVSQASRTTSGEFATRHANIFASGGFGKLSLGDGDGAANGNMQRDCSGTLVVSWTGPHLVGGGLNFVDDATSTNVLLRSAVNDQDFESRYSRLRYDLPALGPIKLAASQGIKGNADVTEFGLRFDGELGGKIGARLGYSNKDNVTTAGSFETIGGSVSWLHDTGISLTVAHSVTSDGAAGNPDASFFLGKVGYKTGKHAFDVHVAQTEDRAQEGDTADTLGFGYVFTPIKKFQTYAGYRIHSLDRDGADFDDVTTLLAGARLKF